VGDPTDPPVQQMLALVRRRFLPRVALLFKPIGTESVCDHLDRAAPFTKHMRAADGAGTAYICRSHTCDRPVVGPEAFEEALNRAMSRPAVV
jgi:uncharacterized protein YyaL (SSP411 family)